METATSRPAVFLRSLRSLGDGVLALAQRRLELFSVELQEEKLRLIRTFVWVGAAVFAGLLTLTFASLTVVCLFWDTARLAALGGVTAFYAAALLASVLVLRRHLARETKPFAATLEEFNRDRACLRPGN